MVLRIGDPKMIRGIHGHARRLTHYLRRWEPSATTWTGKIGLAKFYVCGRTVGLGVGIIVPEDPIVVEIRRPKRAGARDRQSKRPTDAGSGWRVGPCGGCEVWLPQHAIGGSRPWLWPKRMVEA